MKAIIVLGSERKKGNTYLEAVHLSEQLSCPILDLLDYKIDRFSYEQEYDKADGFLSIMENLTNNYDLIIFATPVYWYSMSGLMKIFFDRITDVLKSEKDIGRKLRGKSMAVLASSNGNSLEEDFWIPFHHTADYLGMHFLGGTHTYDGKDNMEIVETFALELQKNY